MSQAGYPVSPALFCIYIDKLEGCLEESSCAGMTLVGILIILLLYDDDIVLMVRKPYALDMLVVEPNLPDSERLF